MRWPAYLLGLSVLFLASRAGTCGERRCVPQSDPRIWGPHAWTILYHLAYRAERMGMGVDDFYARLTAFAATMPCPACIRDYERNVAALRQATSGMPYPQVLFMLQEAIARPNGRLRHPGPMSQEQARARFERAYAEYRCHADAKAAQLQSLMRGFQ